jgi:hypothetical protein
MNSTAEMDIRTNMKLLSHLNTFGPRIPISAKIFGYFMICAGLFFAYVYMFNPSIAFPGIEIQTVSEQFGLYSTGARIIGSVVGIAVALWFDSAVLLALMLITRVCIELGDIVVGLVVHGGAVDTNTFTLAVLAAVEVFFIVKLLKKSSSPIQT